MISLRKYSAALMAAFDLKTEGKNPDKFGDTVLPVYEATEAFLAINQDFGSSGNQALTNPGDECTLVVPFGQTYRVHHVGGVIVLDPADVALAPRLWLGFRQNTAAATPVVPLTAIETTAATARGVATIAYSFHVPWLAQSGSQFVLALETQLTQPASASIRMMHQLLLA